MSGPGIVTIQNSLKELGYTVEINGIYDDATHKGVIIFQAAFGLVPDGIAGPQTKAFLYQATD